MAKSKKSTPTSTPTLSTLRARGGGGPQTNIVEETHCLRCGLPKSMCQHQTDAKPVMPEPAPVQPKPFK